MLKYIFIIMSLFTLENLFAQQVKSKGLPTSQHYFIEILPNDSIVYGVFEKLTDTSHQKNYFDTKRDFYESLSNNMATPSVSNDKTLVFFHGWLGFRYGRISKYVHTIDKYYVETSNVQRTISVIWNTGNRTYGNSRKKVIEIAEVFKQDFAELTNFIHNSQQNHQFYLLCHSMGNYFFQQLFKNTPNPQMCFKEYILAAPDLDCNVFEKGQDFENLPSMVAQTTLLQHKNDRTLGVSKMLLSKNRMGRHGLTKPTPSVRIIDVTDIRKTDGIADGFTHHLYFYRCPEVIAIIGKSFEEKEVVFE